ncbi:MAG: tyrosine-type recombinase/integrase [Gemmataceae bacterium]
MSRPRIPDPKYRLHRSSGNAVVTLTDAGGRRRDVYLGKHGTAASKREYARVLDEWQTSLHRGSVADRSINELVLAFMQFAETYYGENAMELENYACAFRPLKATYGDLPVCDFGPLRLKTIRGQMITSGLARKTINRRISRIKRLFKWGTEEEIVPPMAYHALQAVAGLSLGRSDAKESEPIKPIQDVFVDATLPHVGRSVRAMIELQRLTAMRPGEAVIMRACDLDTTGDVWLYRPKHHKTQWRGRDRVVAIGPKGQAVIREFLTTDIQRYLFSPYRDREERYAKMRSARKTPVQPSQRNRRSRRPQLLPGDHFDVHSYRRAIARAVKAANTEIQKKAKEEGREITEGNLIPTWRPNQLRHSKATATRKMFGLEAAQVVLGHCRADVTQHYAERDESLAMDVARRTG